MRIVEASRVKGRVAAPPSKSHTVRAVLLAGLAEGRSVLVRPSRCEDALAALDLARTLGARVEEQGEEMALTGGPSSAGGVFECGESGFCLRAGTALAALFDSECTVTGRGSLMSRPVGPVETPLRALGARCETAGGLPPVSVRGPLRGGVAEVDGSHGSQFLSGLLMALPLCPGDSRVRVEGLRSGPYVRMTLACIEAFGGRVEHEADLSRFRIRGGQRYRATRVEVEGDWSGASFLLVAGAVAGEAEVTGLDPGSLQPDRAVLSALSDAGAEITWGSEALRVRRGDLRAFDFDLTDCPDLFPPLAVLACACAGTSVLKGVGRLRTKESDRAAALVSELGRLGGRLRLDGDRMVIRGGPLWGGEVDSGGDHRIAMAGAVAGLLCPNGAAVVGEACVAKSYPGFFDDLDSIRMES
ncbi:MAG: 3-phosphoshikimate 1-carboxyvinyltransferase [Acidobacteriota bacterium]